MPYFSPFSGAKKNFTIITGIPVKNPDKYKGALLKTLALQKGKRLFIFGYEIFLPNRIFTCGFYYLPEKLWPITQFYESVKAKD